MTQKCLPWERDSRIYPQPGNADPLGKSSVMKCSPIGQKLTAMEGSTTGQKLRVMRCSTTGRKLTASHGMLTHWAKAHSHERCLFVGQKLTGNPSCLKFLSWFLFDSVGILFEGVVSVCCSFFSDLNILPKGTLCSVWNGLYRDLQLAVLNRHPS